jgi:O-antigen/teichoic acid export membrane protein
VARLKSGSREDALRQLSYGGALLFAILAPAAVGVALVTPELASLMIAEPFRAATVMILPIAAVSGALRNFRMHFGDQTMLLLERTPLAIWVNVVEAGATIVGCAVGAMTGGFVGAALGCLFGTIVGFVFGFAIAIGKFGLPLPFNAMGRIALATAVMATIVNLLRLHPAFASGWLQLALEIGAGGAAYTGALALLYPRELVERLYRVGLLRRPARA